jgi:hypothetical protein
VRVLPLDGARKPMKAKVSKCGHDQEGEKCSDASLCGMDHRHVGSRLCDMWRARRSRLPPSQRPLRELDASGLLPWASRSWRTAGAKPQDGADDQREFEEAAGGAEVRLSFRPLLPLLTLPG